MFSHLRCQTLQEPGICPILISPSPATPSDYVSLHPLSNARRLVDTRHGQGGSRPVREPDWVKHPRSAVSGCVSTIGPRTPPSPPSSAEQIWDVGMQNVRHGRRSQQAVLVPSTAQRSSKRTSDATVLDLIRCYTSDSSLNHGPSPNSPETSAQDTAICSSTLFDFGFSVETLPHARNGTAKQSQPSPGEPYQATEDTLRSFEAQRPARSSEANSEQKSKPLFDHPQFIQNSRLYVTGNSHGHDGTVLLPRRLGSRGDPLLTRTSVDRVQREPAILQLKADSPTSSCRSGDRLTASSDGLSTPTEAVQSASFALQHAVSVFEDDDERTRLMDLIKWPFHSSTRRSVPRCLDAEKTQRVGKTSIRRSLLRLLTCGYTSMEL